MSSFAPFVLPPMWFIVSLVRLDPLFEELVVRNVSLLLTWDIANGRREIGRGLHIGWLCPTDLFRFINIYGGGGARQQGIFEKIQETL